jgi:hypothetical protein
VLNEQETPKIWNKFINKRAQHPPQIFIFYNLYNVSHLYNKVGLIIRFIRLIIKRKFKPCWSIIITCAASKLVMKCTLCHLHVLLLTGFLTEWYYTRRQLFTLPKHLSTPTAISGFVMLDLWFFVYCVVDLCMSLCPYYFGHCVVCHFSMYHLGIFKLFLVINIR